VRTIISSIIGGLTGLGLGWLGYTWMTVEFWLALFFVFAVYVAGYTVGRLTEMDYWT